MLTSGPASPPSSPSFRDALAAPEQQREAGVELEPQAVWAGEGAGLEGPHRPDPDPPPGSIPAPAGYL